MDLVVLLEVSIICIQNGICLVLLLVALHPLFRGNSRNDTKSCPSCQ